MQEIQITNGAGIGKVLTSGSDGSASWLAIPTPNSGDFNTDVRVQSNKVIEFGAGVGGKDVNAVKIGYGTFSGGQSLDIVGAGTSGTNRKIQFWNEGGATFNGDLIVNNNTVYKPTLIFGPSNAGEKIYANRVSGTADLYSLKFQTNSVDQMIIQLDGNIRMNNSLNVNGAISTNNGSDINLKASSGASNDAGDLVFRKFNGTEMAKIYTDPTGIGTIIFRTNGVDRFSIQNDGNVIINNDLSVGGNINMTGNINATGITVNSSFLRLYNPNLPATTKTWEFNTSTDNGAYFYIDELGNGRHFKIKAGGQVIIGSRANSALDAKLTVDGTISSTKSVVTQLNWADYVLDANYKMPTLAETEAYIKTHKHLPGIPSEKEIAEKGIDTGEMLKLQMAKIEELTLLLIQQQKEIEALKAR